MVWFRPHPPSPLKKINTRKHLPLPHCTSGSSVCWGTPDPIGHMSPVKRCIDLIFSCMEFLLSILHIFSLDVPKVLHYKIQAGSLDKDRMKCIKRVLLLMPSVSKINTTSILQSILPSKTYSGYIFIMFSLKYYVRITNLRLSHVLYHVD